MTTVRWPRPPTLGAPHTPLQVVEASAGTGKTYFLEHKVVDLLLGADATIDRIVVVTYTDKATAELRARIRRLLTQMVWGAPPPAVCRRRGTTWSVLPAHRAKAVRSGIASATARIMTRC